MLDADPDPEPDRLTAEAPLLPALTDKKPLPPTLNADPEPDMLDVVGLGGVEVNDVVLDCPASVGKSDHSETMFRPVMLDHADPRSDKKVMSVTTSSSSSTVPEEGNLS
eukprot:1074089-Rhodomonas_salina.1